MKRIKGTKAPNYSVRARGEAYGDTLEKAIIGGSGRNNDPPRVACVSALLELQGPLEFGKRKRFGRRRSQNSEGGFFYIGGQAGSVYSTVYREAIPETAKLTETGDSQVLVLQN